MSGRRRPEGHLFATIVVWLFVAALVVIVLKWLAITAVILVVPFTIWWFYDRRQRAHTAAERSGSAEHGTGPARP